MFEVNIPLKKKVANICSLLGEPPSRYVSSQTFLCVWCHCCSLLSMSQNNGVLVNSSLTQDISASSLPSRRLGHLAWGQLSDGGQLLSIPLKTHSWHVYQPSIPNTLDSFLVGEFHLPMIRIWGERPDGCSFYFHLPSQSWSQTFAYLGQRACHAPWGLQLIAQLEMYWKERKKKWAH